MAENIPKPKNERYQPKIQAQLTLDRINAK